MKQIKLSKRMKNMLRKLDGKLQISKHCLQRGIIKNEQYKVEINKYCDEFEKMVSSMYHFGLLNDNDTRFGDEWNILHVVGNIKYYYICHDNFDFQII